ncbi:MAG TPA: thioesterase family protein [Flavisolibacter sp.]|nr:thioesterase family protein [Flavisolibacter sp.]
MSRIKIKVPQHFSFSTIIPIRITDINYGGHVGNDSILTLIHEARMQFLKTMNYSEIDLEGVSLIMSDAGIEFKSELFYGDSIKVFVACDDFSGVAFNFYYKVVHAETEKVIAMVKTGMVCFDYNKRKIVPVPENVKANLLATH